MKRTLLAATVVALATGWVYSRALAAAPVYLQHDEVYFALQSQSVATTGRDQSGNRFPLYFQEPGFSVGRDPVYIYATALFLQFLPLNESTLRLPSIIAGAVTVGLLVIAASELFGSVIFGIIAGTFLALTPTMFIHSRQALSVIHPLPFVISWLTLLLIYSRTNRRSVLVAAIGILAAGFYSYLGMSVFVPLYVGFTVAILGARKRWAHIGLALAALAVMLIPMAAWHVTHPSRIGEIIESYRIYDPSLNPLQGSRDLVSWASWFRIPGAYLRDWAATHPEEGVRWLPESLRSLWHYHLEMWQFHNNLTAEHAYAAHPLGWLIQWRPTSFFY